ncbi:glycogen phosphorylase-like isoform X1 [Sitodiplosis mosellana]|nr:glycogen phosphorylase-like isoform X1 [Sitodiplosis mosellana]XP_055303003.1 glycogen phosphorylase-like isoform X1 [Sitodiplosis mosellana]
MGNGSVKATKDDNDNVFKNEKQKQISVRGIAQLENVNEIKAGFNRHLHYTLIKDRNIATTHDFYMALAATVKDHIVSRWIRTQQLSYQRDPKRVYYLSMEYNMGRFLQNNMINIGIEDACDEAMYQLGLDIEELEAVEGELHFSNGSMGRLSACFLDSMASLGIPSYGYGIRYNAGAFTQRIIDGEQHEDVDDWLRLGNPWERARPEYLFPVHFYGRLANTPIGREWVDTQVVYAVPHDFPIPGYMNNVVNTLRLWSAKSTEGFKLKLFNNGDYIQAIFDRCLAENITRVMYPTAANTTENQEIRLKQEYFLCSASLQDIIARYKSSKVAQTDTGRTDYNNFAEKNIIQLNNTYSAWVIPELMRHLIDVEHYSWTSAWKIVRQSCAFTSHNILSETLEKWPVDLIQKVLPRHMEILYQINFFHLENLKETFCVNLDSVYGLSCISNECFDMATLAVLGSCAINGVSKFHSNYLKNVTFSRLYELEPEKFLNITNGITPRRWLFLCNPTLSNVISEKLGDKWPVQSEKLESLRKLCRDNNFMRAVSKAKEDNKLKLAETIHKKYGIMIDPYSLFDVQVHRVHEYKRQWLNILHIVTLYNRIKYNKNYLSKTRRTVFIGGKAEPGDAIGKSIIKLITSIAKMINDCPAIDGKLKVIVLENYGVTVAEEIIPCADLSQHLTLPGSEASGTSHIKFMLNGALIIATLDGATLEIVNEVGHVNMFIFGMNFDERKALQSKKYDPMEVYRSNADLKQCLDQIRNGYFSPGNLDEFTDLVDRLLAEDKYFILADYEDYVHTQDLVSATYEDKKKWNEMVIRNIAVGGRFSIDRTAREYAKLIWNVEPNMQPLPAPAD